MTLNGTLFAQAINFFIAYVLLRWLYFKPAIAQIKQEEESTTDVKNIISERSLAIERKQQQQKEHWLACQQYCQEQMPSIAKPDFLMFAVDTPAIEQFVCDEIKLKQLSNMVTDVLAQRIDHVS